MLSIGIIDDDDVGREQVRRCLVGSHPGAEITESGSAADGARMLLESDVQCAILDYQLGDGTAFELLARVREQRPDFHIPLILLTGMGSEDVAVQALKLGIHEYVNKDRLDSEQLGKALRTAMAEHKLRLAEQQHKEALEYQSMHDELTLLPNRRLFLDRLEQPPEARRLEIVPP